ncbi:MAG: hypothetical protein R3E38_06925 [Nitrosomonas sp.]|nr:hypothetical protein [Nitrosomonas sp.]
MREIIDINSLSEIEKIFILKIPGVTIAFDLGIVNPEFYIESGQKYISGNCKVCRYAVRINNHRKAGKVIEMCQQHLTRRSTDSKLLFPLHYAPAVRLAWRYMF